MRLSSGYGPGRPEIDYAARLDSATRRQEHGWATYGPLAGLSAGAFTTMQFEFLLGARAVPAGGQLGIAWRWPFDWAPLQNHDPAGPGYVTAEVVPAGADHRVEFATRYEAYGGIEPFHHYLSLDVRGGAFGRGDRVRVVCGDTSAGGPGWRAPTCAARGVEFLMLVAPEGNQRWTRLPGGEPFVVAPGPAERMGLAAPSDVVAGEAFDAIVRLEDKWGNATPAKGGLEVAGAQCVERRTIASPPAVHLTLIVDEPGTRRLTAALPAAGLHAESNPLRVHAEPPVVRTFWGDLHSGQSLIGCGAGTLAEHYAYGRDAAGLQFITHQANDHYVTTDDWLETRRETEAFHEPGRYVTLLGCEWSPYTVDGGDRNIIYNYDETRLRRSARFFTESEPDPEPDVPAGPQYCEAFADLDVLVNMHVGGRPTNLNWHVPAIEKLAEVHSTHGTSQWFVEDCLQRGYVVGVTAGTDGVMGRPGACHPGWRLIRNVRNGLTAVIAEELTRESLWGALHARSCYATSGPRILLSVKVDGRGMGQEFETASAPRVEVEVGGTAPIERVELMRGTEVIHVWQVAPPGDVSTDGLRVLFGGTAERGTARRQRVVWDGTLEVSGGTIQEVAPIGLQSPLDEVRLDGPQRIVFRTATAGNDAGMLLRLEGDAATRFHFRSGPRCLEFQLGDVCETPLRVDAGGVGRYVSAGPAPRPDAPRRATLAYVDEQPAAGPCPYWVRVVQTDQEKAWSTPVYVKRR